jgi:phosphate transport system protein
VVVATEVSARAAEIDELLVRMFTLVSEGLSAATVAFLSGNRAIARDVVAADRELDDLQQQLELLVERRLLAAADLDTQELRLLVSALRIAPELERSGDLIEHIAMRTPQPLLADLGRRARGLLQEMARLSSVLWRNASDAYVDRDASRLAQLREWDDDLDDLHVELTEELRRSGVSAAVAIELGLVARFYERLGDHAVNIARRVGYLVNG